jgi:hypothetical protein
MAQMEFERITTEGGPAVEAVVRKRSRNTRLFAITAAILGGALTAFLVGRISVHFLVEWWWFESTEQGFIFWQRLF